MPDLDPTQSMAGMAGSAAASGAARRRAQVGLLVASAVALSLTLAVATGSHVLDGFDQAITDLVRGWADPLGWPVDVAHVIGFFTSSVASLLMGGVLILVLFATRYDAAAALLAISCVSGVIVSEVMKRALDRMRPPGAEQFESDLDQSFPSGHAMVGIFLYLAVGVVLIQIGHHKGRRWFMRLVGVTLVIVGPCIGLSRLVLGVHWPSDVIAGWAFGSMVLITSALVLWWPLDRGWTGQGWRATPDPAPPMGLPATPRPQPPEAGSMPAAPAG